MSSEARDACELEQLTLGCTVASASFYKKTVHREHYEGGACFRASHAELCSRMHGDGGQSIPKAFLGAATK